MSNKGEKIKKSKNSNLIVYIILLVGVAVLLVSFGNGILGSKNSSNGDTLTSSGNNEEDDSGQEEESSGQELDPEATNIPQELQGFIISEAQKAVKESLGNDNIAFPQGSDYYLIIKTTSDKKDEGYTRYTITSYYTVESENPMEQNQDYIVVLDIKSENDPIYNIGVFTK